MEDFGRHGLDAVKVVANHSGQTRLADFLQLLWNIWEKTNIFMSFLFWHFRKCCHLSKAKRTSREGGRRDVVFVPEPIRFAEQRELVCQNAAQSRTNNGT